MTPLCLTLAVLIGASVAENNPLAEKSEQTGAPDLHGLQGTDSVIKSALRGLQDCKQKKYDVHVDEGDFTDAFIKTWNRRRCRLERANAITDDWKFVDCESALQVNKESTMLWLPSSYEVECEKGHGILSAFRGESCSWTADAHTNYAREAYTNYARECFAR
jgi:hypothetical protein